MSCKDTKNIVSAKFILVFLPISAIFKLHFLQLSAKFILLFLPICAKFKMHFLQLSAKFILK